MSTKSAFSEQKPQNPLYQTTSSSYGSLTPTDHTKPVQTHGKSTQFSEHLGKSGMYRNSSLNTAVDRSRVLDKYHE